MTSESETAPSGSRTQEFRRLEVKYIVDRTRRTGLARDLSALLRPDAHAGPDGTYMIRSLYFDTRDYMAYKEKLDGTAVRHKLRARVYGEPSEATWVRLEIKSRYLGFIYKISADVSRADWPVVERALRRGILPPSRFLEEPGVREFFRYQRLYNLVPTIIVEYRRQAWERVAFRRTRANFDDRLQGSRHLDLLGPLRAPRPLLGCGRAVFEVKVDGVLPFWMHTLIAKYDLHAEAVSKYCHAVRSEARMTAIGREQDLVRAPEGVGVWNPAGRPAGQSA